MSVTEKGFGSRQLWIRVCSRDPRLLGLNVGPEWICGILQKWQLRVKGEVQEIR